MKAHHVKKNATSTGILLGAWTRVPWLSADTLIGAQARRRVSKLAPDDGTQAGRTDDAGAKARERSRPGRTARARATFHWKTLHGCRIDRFDFSSTASDSISVPGDCQAETSIGVGTAAGCCGLKPLPPICFDTSPARKKVETIDEIHGERRNGSRDHVSECSP